MKVFKLSLTFLHLNLIHSTRTLCSKSSTSNMAPPTLIRHDGVKINYDPYAPEMIAKYGAPGKTDKEGFDPYSDSVGPGIYGGTVKRDENGEIVIGKQYQVRKIPWFQICESKTIFIQGAQKQTWTSLCWRRIYSNEQCLEVGRKSNCTST